VATHRAEYWSLKKILLKSWLLLKEKFSEEYFRELKYMKLGESDIINSQCSCLEI